MTDLVLFEALAYVMLKNFYVVKQTRSFKRHLPWATKQMQNYLLGRPLPGARKKHCEDFLRTFQGTTVVGEQKISVALDVFLSKRRA